MGRGGAQDPQPGLEGARRRCCRADPEAMRIRSRSGPHPRVGAVARGCRRPVGHSHRADGSTWRVNVAQVWATASRTGKQVIQSVHQTRGAGRLPSPGDQAETALRDCDERLRLKSIQIPTINAASIPMTGDKSTATSRPTVRAIAAVTTSHQKPKPRSLPIVAMNRDLIKRTRDLI